MVFMQCWLLYKTRTGFYVEVEANLTAFSTQHARTKDSYNLSELQTDSLVPDSNELKNYIKSIIQSFMWLANQI